MKEYLIALQDCYENGEDIISRAGKVRRLFGHQMKFNLEKGFPIITTKKVAWKSIVSELLWFLEGSNDERRLAEILYEKNRSELSEKKTIWTFIRNFHHSRDRCLSISNVRSPNYLRVSFFIFFFENFTIRECLH